MHTAAFYCQRRLISLSAAPNLGDLGQLIQNYILDLTQFNHVTTGIFSIVDVVGCVDDTNPLTRKLLLRVVLLLW